MFTSWNAPLSQGGTSEEMALAFGSGRAARLLVIPPLFDEHNKLRHQLVEVMRRLDDTGVDSVLPDLPGGNESPAPLNSETITGWHAAIRAAAAHFGITHQFAVRSGAVLLADERPAIALAPQSGTKLLRAMVRARSLASREAGIEEKPQDILDRGRSEGAELAGWALGPEMISELETAEPPSGLEPRVVEQAEIGGTPLWLRAEADSDPDQARVLANLIADHIASGA